MLICVPCSPLVLILLVLTIMPLPLEPDGLRESEAHGEPRTSGRSVSGAVYVACWFALALVQARQAWSGPCNFLFYFFKKIIFTDRLLKKLISYLDSGTVYQSS
jgi:hypothetical protein